MRRALLTLTLLAGISIGAFVVSRPVSAQSIGGGGGGGTMSADAIMDAVQTIDGAASQLDADFLDGISSAGFAQTYAMTGAGVTCAAGGGVSTLSLDPTCPDAGGVALVPLVNSDADGCTVTIAEAAAEVGCTAIVYLVSSAGGVVTMADVTNVANLSSSWTPTAGDTLTLVYQDLSNDQWQEVDRTIVDVNNDVNLTADGNDWNLLTTSGGAIARFRNVSSILQMRSAAASGTIMQMGGTAGTLHLGAVDNRAASAYVSCMTDDLDGSGGLLFCSYGSGLTSTETPQTCDCGTTGTPNTVTCDVQSNVVYLTDGDADACTVTLSETTAAAINKDVGPVRIIVTSLGGGGSYTIADSAGVIELAGGTSFTGDSVGDVLTVQYLSDSTTDTWLEVARANN